MIYRLSLGRRGTALLTLSLLCLGFAPATPAAAQAPPTPDQSYYWCRYGLQFHDQNVQYVTRVLVNPKPVARGYAQDPVGRAFARYLFKTYSPENRDEVVTWDNHWAPLCVTSWPYGRLSLQKPHDTAIAAGAKEVDWQYTLDQDDGSTPSPQSAAPTTPQTPAQAAAASHCQHRFYPGTFEECMKHFEQAASAAPAQTPPSHVATANTAPPPAVHPPVTHAGPNPPAPKPPAPKPPVPKPPADIFVVCVADSDPHTKYVNPPVESAGGNAAQWMKAYRAYINERYTYRGAIRCVRQPTPEAAQALYDRTLTAMRTKVGNGGAQAKIVATDWKK